MMHDSDDMLLRAARGDADARMVEGSPMLRAAQRAGDAARSGIDLPEMIAPPAELWSSIAAAAGVPAEPSTPEASKVVALPRRRMQWLAAAAAVLVVVGVSVGVAVRSSSDDAPRDTIVAKMPLKTLETGSTGRAEIVRHNGRLELKVTASVPAVAGHFHELWLLNRDVSGLVSLGPLESGRAYPLPAGLRLDDYPLVDVSVEREDGDPGHSGKSVLRGDMGAPNLTA